MKTSQATAVLATCLAARLPIMLVGQPGVGKTDIVGAAAKGLDMDIIVSHPAVEDPTAVSGLPWPSKSKKEATFLPFGQLAKALSATKPTVWFVDDLGQANNAMQAAYMQLFLARRVNEHVLSEHITFVAATNRRSDRAGVGGILEPVKSRFATILNVEPDLDDWTVWAIDNDVPLEVIHFLRFRSEFFNKFDPSVDMTNSPCPRTWHHVGNLFKAGIAPEQELEVYGGAIGQAAATEFTGFLQCYRDLPNLDAILLDPDQARIPSGISALVATCAGLANKATKTNFPRIVRYAERLHGDAKSEFGVLLTKECVRKDPDVANTAAFTKLMAGDMGRLIAA